MDRWTALTASNDGRVIGRDVQIKRQCCIGKVLLLHLLRLADQACQRRLLGGVLFVAALPSLRTPFPPHLPGSPHEVLAAGHQR